MLTITNHERFDWKKRCSHKLVTEGAIEAGNKDNKSCHAKYSRKCGLEKELRYSN